MTDTGPLAAAAHHVAISVRNLDDSVGFYRFLGYEALLRWDAPDASLSIAHLGLADGHLLELFAYTANRTEPAPVTTAAVGNDLEAVGVKHFALRVDDVHDAHARVSGCWPHRTTSVQHGRTGIDYFFVADPDGLWVEIAQDDRDLPWRRSGAFSKPAAPDEARPDSSLRRIAPTD